MKLAKQFEGLKAICQLTGAKTYDRLVGYCTINGADFGRHMIDNSSCTVWKKYDVWKKYQNQKALIFRFWFIYLLLLTR